MQLGDNIGLGLQAATETARIVARTDGSTSALEAWRDGDGSGRMRLWDNGIEFGPGSSAPDVSLIRSGVGQLAASGSLSATWFTSTVATGVAPFAVASTTQVTNLNANLWQGRTIRACAAVSGSTFEIGGIYWDGAKWAHENATVGRLGWTIRHGDASDAVAGAGGEFQVVFGTTGSTGAGTTAEPTKVFRADRSGRVQFDRYISTVATGTPPFTSTSTTECPNLNAALLQGSPASAFAAVGHTHAGVYEPVFSKGSLIQGSGVTLTGTLSGRLVGSGDITISATGGSTNLDGLTDVTISSPVSGQFLKYSGSAWVNTSHGLTYSDVGASPVGHNHDSEYARLSGSAQTISAATTFDTGLKVTGMGADISGSGDWRAIVRDQSSSGFRTMTAAFMRGWLDAAAFSHTHAIADVSGLQTALDGKLSNAATGVTATSYGAASGQSVPYFTVNAQGQLTAAGSRNITAADLGASATLVFVTTNEMTFAGGQLTDGTYRTALGSIRSPLSTTLSAGALASGYVLRIEAFGSFQGNDGYLPKLRVKVGSSYTAEFQIDEPNSMSMTAAGAWNAVVNLLVVTSGSSATVVTRGHFDVGAPNSGASDYVIRTKPTISGTLNTTVSNAIAVDFAGSANVVAFSCSSVIATII